MSTPLDEKDDNHMSITEKQHQNHEVTLCFIIYKDLRRKEASKPLSYQHRTLDARRYR